MKLLLIDTCGAIGSVVLANTDCQPAVVADARLPGRTASERLVATIKDLTVRAGISLRSLDAVVVVHGPGSFTGVRVGLSAAKGLCEALNLPLIGISRLAVLARLADPHEGARVCALIDAGRGEFYSGDYADGVCLREALRTCAELLAAIDRDASEVAGDVSAPNAASLIVVTCETSVAESLATLDPQLVAEPTAEDALPLALLRLQARDFDDDATLDANYLRRTDAEIFAKPRPGAAPTRQSEPAAG